MSVPVSLPVTLVQGTTANAPDVMADFNALVGAFGLAAAAGTNNDITSLNALTTPITPTQGGTNVFLGGTSTGSANAQVVSSTTPNSFSLTAGLMVTFIPGFSNTGAMTLQIGLLPAKNVLKYSIGFLAALTGGEVQVNIPVLAYYDGTEFYLVSTGPQFGGFGPLNVIPSAVTCDITAAPGHLVSITGGPFTITSFGTNVSFATPIYMIYWMSNNTLSTAGNISFLPGGVASFAVAPNDVSIVFDNGAGWFVLGHFKASGLPNSPQAVPTPLAGATTVTISNNAVTPNTKFDYAANQAVMVNPSTGLTVYATNISGTCDTTLGNVTSIVNGMDGEAPPAPGWIYIFLISNGTTTGALACNTTTPTMPAGYLYRTRIGAMRFDAGPVLFRTKQIGQRAQYVVTAGSANTTLLPNIDNGVKGTFSLTAPVWQAASVSSHVPSLAKTIYVVVTNRWKAGVLAEVFVAPNNAYAGPQSGAGNIPPFTADQAFSYQYTTTISLMLETLQVFWLSDQTGGAISCLGWEDSANVN